MTASQVTGNATPDLVRDAGRRMVGLTSSVHPAWSARTQILPPLQHMNDAKPLWTVLLPTLRNTPPPADPAHVLAIAHKLDAAGRDDRNRPLVSRARVSRFSKSVWCWIVPDRTASQARSGG